MKKEPVKVLTIGGSDSGGAAGLQADLKTWTALGAYGMSVVTVVTAQNSERVTAVEYMSPDFLTAQLEAVLSDYGAQAIKTGFIGRSSLIKAATAVLREHQPDNMIVDPVLVNHQGQFMFDQELIQAYRSHLLPMSQIITPNWREARLLADLSTDVLLTSPTVQETIAALHELGVDHILITGHIAGDQVYDYWSDGNQLRQLAGSFIVTNNDHGSGDTLSAALCAFLAQGCAVVDAIDNARRFTAQALQGATTWRLGAGHGPLSHFSQEI